MKTVYSDGSKDSTWAEISGGISSKVPLGFLDMNIGSAAETKSERHHTGTLETSGRKVHTSVSLFAKMRRILKDSGTLKTTGSENLKAGDFIEIKSKLQKNGNCSNS